MNKSSQRAFNRMTTGLAGKQVMHWVPTQGGAGQVFVNILNSLVSDTISFLHDYIKAMEM